MATPETLYRAHGRAVFAVCLANTHNHHDAEDVLRLAAPPTRIAVGTATVAAGEGAGSYTLANVANGGVVVMLRRTGGNTVTVSY